MAYDGSATNLMYFYGFLDVFVNQLLDSGRDYNMTVAAEVATGNGDHFQPSIKVDSLAISNKQSINTTLRFREKISEIIEDSQKAEHELCTACTTFLVELLTIRLEKACLELTNYSTFVSSLEDRIQDNDLDKDLESLTRILNETAQEEQSLLEKLDEVRQERVQVKKEIDCAILEQGKLNNTMKKYFENEAEQKARELEASAEYESLESTLERYVRHSDKIRKHHLLLNVFVINTSRKIAVINGCRIGCLVEEFVGWDEINFGIGQLCLSVTGVANFLEYKFTEYKIVPMAGQSYMIHLDSGKENTHRLYSNSFDERNSEFDSGMSTLLQCIEQLYQEIKRLDNGFKLPYSMKKDCIINDVGQEYRIK